MSKYIDVTNYQDCKIVLHNEDEGIRIKDIPVADVEEIRHGEWRSIGLAYECSECGFYVLNSIFDGAVFYHKGYHYCPNCGAKNG